MALYIGLMSGTSLDGVDGVLADMGHSPGGRVLAHQHAPFPPALRASLLALNTPGANELHTAALAGNALAQLYAQVTQALLAQAQVPAAASVRAIGAHGQTVRHQPQAFDGIGYTLQINQPALLAELTGIAVVADFRSRDVAAGGQGAPLVPPFHKAYFGDATRDIAVLNIGGISNITLLPRDPGSTVTGFDCGPGNALLDLWCEQHTGQTFDDGGQWAATAEVDKALLHNFQREAYFAQPAPKSTGRDLFNRPWLEQKLSSHTGVPAASVQATLTELTAWACAQSLQNTLPTAQRLIVCGGGAYNQELMRRIAAHLPQCEVMPSGVVGLPPLQVEAAAFAWLAAQCIHGIPASLESVTGARGTRILGAVYPA